ncbi:MAG: lytic transglycosylase domain-containing protein [Desulfovibrio sp.]|nr:lytic transglycosylase domain-containing protein [Desulfovibrio sp.]
MSFFRIVCIACPLLLSGGVLCPSAGAVKQIGNLPLYRTPAWRQGVEQLRRYHEGGEAPQPMLVRGFAPVPATSTRMPSPYASFGGQAARSLLRSSAGSFPDHGMPDWGRAVRFAGGKYGISEALLAAILQVESNFNPRAVSPKGARGAMQIMPETGRELGLTDFFDPDANIDAGARYLASLLQTFARTDLALAAYNAGPAAVIKYGGIPPYPETRDYVERVLDLYRRFQAQGLKTSGDAVPLPPGRGAPVPGAAALPPAVQGASPR